MFKKLSSNCGHTDTTYCCYGISWNLIFYSSSHNFWNVSYSQCHRHVCLCLYQVINCIYINLSYPVSFHSMSNSIRCKLGFFPNQLVLSVFVYVSPYPKISWTLSQFLKCLILPLTKNTLQKCHSVCLCLSQVINCIYIKLTYPVSFHSMSNSIRC